jgi:hypothetical protein
MATTEIRVHESGSALVPNISTVPFVYGDSVTFIAPADSTVRLCMNSDTARVFSLSPDGPAPEIPAGGAISFQLADTAPGTYLVLLQWPNSPCPASIKNGTGTTPLLSIQPAGTDSYSGPADDTKT